jgi:hypothetical protein
MGAIDFAAILCLLMFALFLADLVSWLIKSPTPFLYQTRSVAGRTLVRLVAIVNVLGGLAYFTRSFFPLAARIQPFIFPYYLFITGILLFGYSLWRRHAQT